MAENQQNTPKWLYSNWLFLSILFLPFLVIRPVNEFQDVGLPRLALIFVLFLIIKTAQKVAAEPDQVPIPALCVLVPVLATFVILSIPWWFGYPVVQTSKLKPGNYAILAISAREVTLEGLNGRYRVENAHGMFNLKEIGKNIKLP